MDEDEAPTSTDAHFARAMLEALHATEAYVHREHPAIEAPDEEIHVARLDPVERRVEEALRDVEKWRRISLAAHNWS